MSRAGSEARLGRCPSPPSQDIRNRDVEVSRQHLSLIEAATPPAQRVQGDGNDGIGMVKQVTSRDAHQCGERTGQRPPSLVLECVNELAQRAAVVAGRPAKLWWSTRSWNRAAQRSHASGPIGTRSAAPTADRWRDQLDLAPAVAADNPPRRFLERAVTRGAPGCPDQSQDAVQCRAKPRSAWQVRCWSRARRVCPLKTARRTRAVRRCPRVARGRRSDASLR